jgi:hypothetical protein
MALPRHKLTPAVQKDIIAFIRAGGFPHVAAEAAGVPRAVFERWLRKGEARRTARRLRAFADEVRKARAQTRLGAEIAILSDKPLDWLRYGPGRETADSPGWTATVKAAPARQGEVPLLQREEVQALLATLMGALEGFPEPRTAVAARLAEAGHAPPAGNDA